MYKLFVALRYLRANKVIYFSIAGVAVGIMVMIIVTSVMGGFSRDIMARVRGLQAHFVIKTRFPDTYIGDYDALVADLRRLPHVTGAAPRVEYAAWLSYRGTPRTVMVTGVDLKQEQGTSDLLRFFAQGPLGGKQKPDFNFDDGTEPEKPGLVVGSEIFPREGALALLQTFRKGDTPMMLHDEFIVVGSFKSGMAEYDSSYVFMDLEAIQKFMKLDKVVTTVAIGVDDYERCGAETRRAIIEAHHARHPCKSSREHELGYCGRFYVQSWEEVRSILLQAVAIERGIQIIILFCIVIVAGFNIIAIYTMMVRAKTRDVGILRSLGATRGGVTLIFLLSGGLCGLFGSGFGIAAGTVIANYLNEIVGFVRITSRELNRAAWTAGMEAHRGTTWLALTLLVLGFIALMVSWRGLYREFRRDAWLWAAASGGLIAWAFVTFFSWALDYRPLLYDDPPLPGRLGWFVAMATGGALLAWTPLRFLTEPYREGFFGGFIRIAGTVLYAALTIFLVGAIAICGALLLTAPSPLFQGWDLFPRQIYYLDRVPVLIDPTTVVGIVLATLFVSLVFSLYPALRAASYDPIEAIRDE